MISRRMIKKIAYARAQRVGAISSRDISRVLYERYGEPVASSQVICHILAEMVQDGELRVIMKRQRITIYGVA